MLIFSQVSHTRVACPMIFTPELLWKTCQNRLWQGHIVHHANTRRLGPHWSRSISMLAIYDCWTLHTHPLPLWYQKWTPLQYPVGLMTTVSWTWTPSWMHILCLALTISSQIVVREEFGQNSTWPTLSFRHWFTLMTSPWQLSAHLSDCMNGSWCQWGWKMLHQSINTEWQLLYTSTLAIFVMCT